jgi:hypothetical protein
MQHMQILVRDLMIKSKVGVCHRRPPTHLFSQYDAKTAAAGYIHLLWLLLLRSWLFLLRSLS